MISISSSLDRVPSVDMRRVSVDLGALFDEQFSNHDIA